MSFDSASLTTPDIKWLGVRPSDLDKYHIPEQCRQFCRASPVVTELFITIYFAGLPMTPFDIKTGKELMEEQFIKNNPEWVAELKIMVQSKTKAEIR